MSTNLIERSSNVPSVTWSAEQVELIKRTIAVGATDDELKLFLYAAKRSGLDPLSKQIHFVKRQGKGTIQTAIDGYRLIADRTGKYAGNADYLYDEGLSEYLHIQTKRGNPVTATATVSKLVAGEVCTFAATARWAEYCPSDEKSTFMWTKMPYLMLGKCAEALALRKAFPAELSGLYTDEEMEQAGNGQANRPAAPNTDPSFLLPGYMGHYANLAINDPTVPLDTLQECAEGLARALEKPPQKGKEKWRKRDAELLPAIKGEITRRQADASQAHAEDEAEPGGDPAQPTAQEIFEDLEATADLADYTRKWKAYLPILAGLGPKGKDRINALHARKQKELS